MFILYTIKMDSICHLILGIDMKTAELFRAAMLCAPLIFVACSKKNEQPEITQAEQPQAADSVNEVEQPNSEFDIQNIPLSTAVLGEFTYIALPDGYEFQNTEQRNFERVPFWTGQQLQWVEGKVFSSGITAKSDYKEGSFLELQRNLDSVIKQLRDGSGNLNNSYK
jgi:hypothetical protein